MVWHWTRPDIGVSIRNSNSIAYGNILLICRHEFLGWPWVWQFVLQHAARFLSRWRENVDFLFHMLQNDQLLQYLQPCSILALLVCQIWLFLLQVSRFLQFSSCCSISRLAASWLCFVPDLTPPTLTWASLWIVWCAASVAPATSSPCTCSQCEPRRAAASNYPVYRNNNNAVCVAHRSPVLACSLNNNTLFWSALQPRFYTDIVRVIYLLRVFGLMHK